jgi:hypothetical protein
MLLHFGSDGKNDKGTLRADFVALDAVSLLDYIPVTFVPCYFFLNAY